MITLPRRPLEPAELGAGPAALAGLLARRGSAPAPRRRGGPPPGPAFSREFAGPGSGDQITTAIGAVPGATGPLTLASLWRPLAVAAGGLLRAFDTGAGTPGLGLNPFSDGNLYIGLSGFTSVPYAVADNWRLDVFRIDPGNPTQRSTYLYDTDGWTDSALAVLLNAGNAPDVIRHGWFITAEVLAGRLAVQAVWPGLLSIPQIRTLSPALAAWEALAAAGLWAYNQADVADPVLDLTGNGADQLSRVGTTVSTDVPPGFVF